ncbi:MAG: DUF459 domain-containing protein [Acidimicrobiia bacterium]|nr:DUF459 domain-containing protein [Acidimicrobiia bacterium]
MGCRAGCTSERLLWAAVGALSLLTMGCGSSAQPGIASTTSAPAQTTTTALPATTLAPTTTSTSAPPTTAPTTSAAPSSTTTTTPPPTTTTTGAPAWWRAVTTDAPLRVWVIGDSLTPPTGSALRALGTQSGLLRVWVEAYEGTGLARPDILDWPALVASGAPAGPIDLVVVLLGTNDGQGLQSPQGRLDFGTPEWEAAYGDLVGSLMDDLLSICRRVYWVGQPIMGGANFDAYMRRISAVVREEAAERLDVRYIDIYRLFQGEDGGFTTQLEDESGTLVTVRSTDGIHYTSGGGRLLAEAIWEVLATDWGLPDA